jgi:hypothetical protein
MSSERCSENYTPRLQAGSAEKPSDPVAPARFFYMGHGYCDVVASSGSICLSHEPPDEFTRFRRFRNHLRDLLLGQFFAQAIRAQQEYISREYRVLVQIDLYLRVRAKRTG